MAKNRIEWTLTQESFIAINWPYMSVTKLAEAFNAKFNTNIRSHAIDSKIDRMKLPKKRELRREVGNEEWKLEIEGRKKTIELNKIRSSFNLNEHVNVKVTETITKPVIKVLEGEVIDKTTEFITVQSGNYRECFKYTDFYTGRAMVV